MIALRRLFCTATIFVLLSCAKQSATVSARVIQRPEGAYQVIGAVGSVDRDTKRIIELILAERGIRVGFAGTIVHDIYVQQDRVDEARRLLKNDPRLKGKWVKLNQH